MININEDFRIFMNASHIAFLNTKTQIKLKRFFFGKLETNFCWQCYDLNMYQNSEKNINI